ncbi:MAG: enoyl-CoA hydratase/isomerase family protein [Candidatus Dormibacteria bacterium]
MSFENITYEVGEGVATITLNRPQAFNALNQALSYELLDAFTSAEADASVRAIVLTGAGRAFCSGQDLKDVQEGGTDPAEFVRDALNKRYSPLVSAIRNIPKPVIGAINGVAAGAGMSLALATDIRMASDKASFTMAFSRVGLIPDAGGNWFLPRAVGLARALELAWTSRRVGADEALGIGLVNRVVPDDRLAVEAGDMARSLARGPALALALTKEAMNRAMVSSLPETLGLEADLQARCVVHADFAEGVSAFVEKREPRFGGVPGHRGS